MSHHHEIPSQMVHVPRMFRDFKIALASLYSLPLSPEFDNGPRPTPAQSHEFLMFVQSRNARRKILSIQQRVRDQQGNGNKVGDSTDADQQSVQMGSSWLASLALLCHMKQSSFEFVASPTERLFAAQTLLHRLRRVKMVEAIDLEIEQPQDANFQTCLGLYQTNQHVENLVPSYKQWMKSINPFVGCILESYQSASTQTIEDEERIKGDLTLLTLAAVSYLVAISDPLNNEHSQANNKSETIRPLLSTCTSALITTALRLRFTPTSIDQYQGATPNTQPVVKMIQHCFDLVWKAANHMQHPIQNQLALNSVLHICLGCIPDTIMGSPGGARGKLSLDPRCLQAAIQELRTVDSNLLGELLHQQAEQNASTQEKQYLDMLIIQTCARWASFLQLSAPLLDLVMPLVNAHLSRYSDVSNEERKAVFDFLIALFESGAWTVDQIISTGQGFTNQSQDVGQQATKKKQSSRSKKRQKEAIDKQITDSHILSAHEEMKTRGEISCQGAIMIWAAFSDVFNSVLTVYETSPDQVEGEGPIGCLAACANACLPHLLRNPLTPHGQELFLKITEGYQRMCLNANKTVRGLTFEPLYTLHGVVIEICQTQGGLDRNFESALVDHFFKCSMSLASLCGFPGDYFNDMNAPSDQELEMERKDVRDLLRSVTGSGEGGSTKAVELSGEPHSVCVQILSNLVEACKNSIFSAREQKRIFPETAAHAFSSLAKPLNHLAKFFSKSTTRNDIQQILQSALITFMEINNVTIECFQHSLPIPEIFPRSKIANLAIASLSPMLSSLLSCQTHNAALANAVSPALDSAIHSSILSLEHIPELCAPSILEFSMYDIRGAFRGPGGEDHLGCLSLMRLANESDHLARHMVRICIPYVPRLCKLHHELKQIEVGRGKGVFHGHGVAPVSRRILVNVLCRLEIISEGQFGASSTLSELLDATVAAVLSFKTQSSINEDSLFFTTECVYDLASFSPSIVSSLFDPDPDAGKRTVCLETITLFCIHGYQVLLHKTEIDEVVIQWNRLRAALFTMLKKCANPDFSDRAGEMLIALITTECDCVSSQCDLGPLTKSSIFADEVISSDGVPAGLFIRNVAEAVVRSNNRKSSTTLPCCLRILTSCSKKVLTTILSKCPDPSDDYFVDPRPTLAESWFSSMVDLMESGHMDPSVEMMLVDTCVAIFSLVFNASSSKSREERRNDPGMSLDGAHTLSATIFIEKFLNMGFHALTAVGQKLLLAIPYDDDRMNQVSTDRNLHGVSVVGAALFRANQGSFPPWAVEAIPDIYKAFFNALNKDVDAFGLAIRLSMEVRLSKEATISFGNVQPGSLLSGRFFENMSAKAKSSFIEETMKLCRKNDGTSWRRLKVLVKQACGGKKKDTDYSQKPSLTKWSFTRA